MSTRTSELGTTNYAVGHSLHRKRAHSWPPAQSFWRDEFSAATRNGTAPHLFKALVPSNFCSAKEITRAFQKIQNPAVRERTGVRARVYIEEERFEDLVAVALETPLKSNDSLVSFMQRVTAAEKFSLVLNNFERVSELFAAELGEFLQSMFLARGVPIGGGEQVVFAGNYSGTAFGIHEGYEHAFLVHLGPGVKDFYCWPQETYLEMTGGRRQPTFGDYEWMLAKGQKFVMEPGDVLYLPALVYHVGRQNDFSCAIAIPLYTYPIERYFSRVIIPGVSASLPFQKEGMSKHIPFSFDSSPLVPSLAAYAEQTFSRWMETELSRIQSYRWYRLISNGGWEISDSYISSPFEEMDLVDELDVREGNALRLIRPYKLCWSRDLNCDAGQLRVFLRGRSIKAPDHASLIPLFERLNSGDTITMDDSEPALAAFRALSRTDGLVID